MSGSDTYLELAKRILAECKSEDEVLATVRAMLSRDGLAHVIVG